MAALAAACVLLGACPADDKPVVIKVIAVPAADKTCAEAPKLDTGIQAATFTLRYTFLERKAKDPDRKELEDVGPVSNRRHELVCFRVIKTKDNVEFVVPTTPKLLTLRVDAFAPDGRLAFSGMYHDLDLSNPPDKIFVQPARAKTCTYAMRPVRAFHSATVLPNGDVLLIGGIGKQAVGTAIGEKQVTRFSPSTLQSAIIKNAPDNEPGLARAFHQAVLLPSPPAGPYDILLIGGVRASAVDGPVVRVVTKGDFTCASSSCPFFFNVLPHEGAQPAETAVVTYTPGARREDLGTITYTPLPNAGIPPSFFPRLTLIDDSSALLVGGADAYSASSAAQHGFDDKQKQATWIALTAMALGGPSATSSSLGTVRAGHAVGRTQEGFLIVGGKLDGDGTSLTANFGEKASQGQSFTPIAATTGIDTTAFQTLTPLGLLDSALFGGGAASELLLAGGFRGQGAATGNNRPYWPQGGISKQAPFHRLGLSLAATSLTIRGSGKAGDFPDAGYHRATRLFGGSVMLSGGNVRTCKQPCNVQKLCPSGTCVAGRCSDDTEHRLCASDQVVVIAPDSDDASPLAPLGQPRYGHVAVRLLDNSVLIHGGMQLTGKQIAPALLLSGEIYTPYSSNIQDMPLWLEREGLLLGVGALTGDDTRAGACLTRADVDKLVGQLAPAAPVDPRLESADGLRKTVTLPAPRTSNRRVMRTIRFRWEGFAARP